VRRRSALAVTAAALALAAPAPAATRDLDRSFGGDGMVLTALGVGDASVNAVATQPDGKILAAGWSYTTRYGGRPTEGLTIVRYLPSGALDRSFGGDGIVVDPFTADGSSADAVAIQPDGKIVVSGQSAPGVAGQVFVARYLPNGERDTGFGEGGRRMLQHVDDSAEARGLSLQSDGQILVGGAYRGAGTGRDDARSDLFVARLSAGGAMDETYGIGGMVVRGGLQSRGDLVVDGGRAVPVGSMLVGGTFDLMLTRFDSSGAVDGTFGGGGIVRDRAGNDDDYVGDDVALWNGKLIATGTRGRYADVQRNYLLARFSRDGALDTTFDATGSDPGHVFASAGDGDPTADALAVEPATGAATVAGSALDGGKRKLMVVRYTSGGLRDDAGFVSANGNVGPRLLDAGDGGETLGHDVLLDAGGKVVVAGSALDGGQRQFFLARLGDTPPTPNARPVAHISGQHRVPRGRWIRFDGFRSSDRDGRIVDYAWRVDGRRWQRVGAVFWHKFRVRGLHTIELRVTDDDGARSYAKSLVSARKRGGS
jgi:uncharacterized delta-60 repeat protein